MICFIIVTYNPQGFKLHELIVNLLKSKDSQVILVNNGYDLNLFEICGSDRVFLINLNQNLGIAYAQNVGVKKAIDLGAEVIIFFDQDSIIEKNFVSEIYSDYLKIKNNNVNIAAIGPRFIDEKKGFYFPALKFNKYGLIDKFSVENIKESIEVSFLISSGTLVSVDALRNIGLMREEFFIDYVDTEWCFRALSKGYKLYMSHNAVMKHSIGDDTIKLLDFKIPVHSGFRRYYRVRNLFFMWKMSYIPKILIAKLIITNFVIQILLFLLKDKKMDYIKYYLKAIRDGIKQSKDYHG